MQINWCTDRLAVRRLLRRFVQGFAMFIAVLVVAAIAISYQMDALLPGPTAIGILFILLAVYLIFGLPRDGHGKRGVCIDAMRRITEKRR